MTEVISVPARRFGELRIVGPICVAHFLSHYYMIILAPLFVFIRADYGVSYTTLALALTAFNVVSAALQTPAGFVVDRIGARVVLIAGVFIGAVAFAVAGLVDSFTVFVVMFGIAGLGNTAYHPADYALLSEYSPPSRIGQIFSFHTFSGILGAAVAPATLLAMQSRFGWRGAFIGAAVLGFLVLVLLLLQRPTNAEANTAAPRPKTQEKIQDDKSPPGASDWRFLLTPPIILNLFFFILISLMGGASTFFVVALMALYGTPDALANVVLTGTLLFSAFGVLLGGYLASRTTKHAVVAATSLALGGIFTASIGLVAFGPYALVVVASLSGLFGGISGPSRDMLVRAVTPKGAFGRVFGFVSSGYNIGSMIAPPIYGLLMDHGHPSSVFLFSAACCIACIATVIFGMTGREQPEARA
jgi:MFS transporter, FSR family, fosmidomycin resistance protein